MNGECFNTTCICDSGWAGSTCAYMNFLPAPANGSYGYYPNITAWGGVPIYAEGHYHLFVAEMINDCGLCTWVRNSRIIHAISKTLLGPFTFSDVAIPVWSHNPQIVVDNSTGSPIYLLFHIGDGTESQTPINCTVKHPDQSSMNDTVPVTSSLLHTATSPYGPWTPQNPTGLESCNNPSPYIYPNGNIYLACSPMWGSDSPNVFTAPNWKGPWTGGVIKYHGNLGMGIWEDPFIWVDKRGVFKMLSHVYPSPSDMRVPFWTRVSGFAYSLDGFNWVVSPEEPYTNVVNHETGVMAYTTRERPKIYFDPYDHVTPIALFNGVAEGSYCWDCKQTCGVDWTYNIAVPLYIEPK